MLHIFDPLRELTLLSVTVRLVLAMVSGGLIGIEREYKRRPAGFRTHILICMGAAITTLTSQYLYLCMGYYTDMARLGAQVIAGIGFIGAGTIIVTRHKRVKGLTTAAGLWVSAVVGLAIGGGFYEAAIFAAVMILLTELLFSRLEYLFMSNTSESMFCMEYTDKKALETALDLLRDKEIKVLSLEITRSEETEDRHASAIFSVRLNRIVTAEVLTTELYAVEGVKTIEEL